MENRRAVEMDVLREIGSIGAGNATTSLSVLLKTKLSMEIPQVNYLEMGELVSLIGGPDKLIINVKSNITGDILGSVLFIMEQKSAKHLLKKLMQNQPEEAEEIQGIGLSVVQEIANIVISTYLSSLESFTGLKTRPGTPEMCVDMAGAVLSTSAFGVVEDIEGSVMMIGSEFVANEIDMKGYVVLVANQDAYDVLFQKLNINL